MQEIIIIAGPNGAGKTSFANEYFPFAREEIYKPLVNEWSVWDSLDGSFRVAEMWND